MRRGQFRFAWLVTGAAAVAALTVGVIVYRTVSTALVEAGVAGTDASHVTSGVAVTLIVLGLLGVATVGVAASAFAGSLGRLRGSVLARARGDVVAFHTFTAELAAIDQAVERLTLRIAERDREVDRGGAEVSTLLDAISEGIVQLDAAGRIAQANPEARALLRLTGQCIGQPVATQVRHAELRQLLERAVTGAPVEAAELSIEDRRLVVSARPLPAPGGGSKGAVVAFVDLTDVRRLESVRRDFVANVSHELKTPLTSIRGYTETLLNDDLPPELARQFLEVVQKNADRLHRIVDDLLDLSRLESGGWRPELLPVDVAELVTDAWSACADRARDRSLTFVPPTAVAAALADPGALRQVMSNLLENALRYTPDGGRIEVTVATVHGHAASPAGAEEQVVIEVRDNGAGIPSDAIPRIFERFYRVDPARSRADGGTGLGLAIVKHLIESMGGDVRAESELGRGTTIRIRLPAASQS
jgi:two-component system, OmpR family, phosphate regulon sensor histidine kinase PhoR